MKSLFTDVLVQWVLEVVRRTIDDLEEEVLMVPRADYVELVSLCQVWSIHLLGWGI